jgi:predicted amidohydrolase
VSGPLRIAAAQYPIDRYDSLEGYKDKLARWVGDAAGEGAQLLVFPEYGAMEWSGPHRDASLAQTLQLVSEAMPEMDTALADFARQHGVHILAPSGPSARGDSRFVNAARLIAPNGRIGVQDKLIMTPFERDWGISPGGPLRVFETALGMIGVAICYDSEFPLLVRAQVEAGARVILIPSCTEFISGYHRIRTGAQARALENTCFTVVSPTVGEARWSPSVDVNSGAAGIFMPADHAQSDTGVLAQGEVNAAQWVYATVDPTALERLVAGGEMRNRADWMRQPGAAPLGAHAEVVSLL